LPVEKKKKKKKITKFNGFMRDTVSLIEKAPLTLSENLICCPFDTFIGVCELVDDA